MCPNEFASNGGCGLGDLWAWTSLLLVKSVAFHTFQRYLDSMERLWNCNIGSIVYQGKGEYAKFYMGSVVKNYIVRKTLVQLKVLE